MRRGECPSHDAIRAFLAGNANEGAHEAVSEHLDTCAECRALVAELDAKYSAVTSSQNPATDDSSQSEHPHVTEEGHQEVRGEARLNETDTWGIGEYLFIQELSATRMATVYKARHAKLNRIVVVKVLNEDLSEDHAAVTRFHREMECTGSIEHPNVVWASDAGESDGRAFIVMEYLQGVTLADLIQPAQPIPSAAACELARQAALGLQCIHEQGLVHRDIKPSNLFLTSDGTVKVLDLGLARWRKADNENEVTLTSATLGTHDYMAPEQASDSRSVDIRGDIYSLGCTLFHLLAGDVPFPTQTYDTSIKKLLAHASAPVPNVRSIRREIPHAVSQIVQQMMAKSVDDRFQRPEQVAVALLPFARSDGLGRLVSESAHPRNDEVERRSRENAITDSSGIRADRVKIRIPESGVSRAAWSVGALLSAVVLITLLTWRGCADDGSLVVEVDQTDCQVEVVNANGNREVFARTNDSGVTVSLTPGEYHLIVRKEGFDEFDSLVVLEPGKTRQVLVRLKGQTHIDQSGSQDGDAESEKEADELGNLALAVKQATNEGLAANSMVAVRSRLVEFCQRNLGRPGYTVAARLLARLAWPVDHLARPEQLSYELQVADQHCRAGQHCQIVAVLGDSRLKHWDQIGDILYTPDGGHLISVSQDESMIMWEMVTGRAVRYFAEPDQVQAFRGAALLPDGKNLLSANLQHRLRYWDFESGMLQKTTICPGPWSGRWNRVWLRFNHDGSALAVCSEKDVLVLDTTTAQIMHRLQGHAVNVSCIAFSLDGSRLVSGDAQGVACVWNVASGLQEFRFESASEVQSVALNHDGRLLATGHNDRKLRIRNLQSAGEQQLTELELEDQIQSLAFGPVDNTLAVSVKFESIQLWDVEPYQLRRRLKLPFKMQCQLLRFSPDGKILALASHIGAIAVWDVSSGQGRFNIDGHRGSVWDVEVAADGTRLVSAGEGGIVAVWDLATGECSQLFDAFGGWKLKSVALTPDNKRLVVSSPIIGETKLVDIAARQVELQWRIINGSYDIPGAVLSPSGDTLAVADAQRRVLLRNLTTADIRILRGHEQRIVDLKFGPSGRSVVSADLAGRVIVWDTESEKPLRQFDLGPEPVTTVAVSADESFLACGRKDGSIAVVRLPVTDGQLALREQPPRTQRHHGVLALSFSPDTRLLASSAGDGAILLWDPHSGKLLTRMQVGPRNGVIRGVCFTPEGRHMIAANGNGTVYVLRLGEPPGAQHAIAELILDQGGSLFLGDPLKAEWLIASHEELPLWEVVIRGVEFLANTEVGDSDLALLRDLRNLELLDLRGTKVSDDGVRCLEEFVELRSLSLNNRISSKGLSYVAKLKELSELAIYGGTITDAGIAELEKLSGLKRLTLQEVQIPGDGLARLKKALSECEVFLQISPGMNSE